MHLGRPGIAHHLDDLEAGGSPNDRIVDQDDALAPDQRRIGIVLQFDAKVADPVARLDESPPDIMRADDPQLKWDPARLAEAQCRGDARIGDGDDVIGHDRGFTRQLGADCLAHFIDRSAVDDAVGAREIDVLENARPRQGGGERAIAFHAGIVDQHQLAGLDVADILGADDVERDRLRGEDHRLAELAHHQRANAERVAARDQAVGGQADQGISPLDLLQRVGQPIERAVLVAARDEVDDDLGVAGRLKDRAALVEPFAERHRVRQIAIVRDREATLGKLGEQGLDVAQGGVAGGRIAVVPDRDPPDQLAHHRVAVEIARNMPHRAVGMIIAAVIADDPGGFLPAVLERVEAQRDEARRLVGAPDREDPALLVKVIVIERVGRQHGLAESLVGDGRHIGTSLRFVAIRFWPAVWELLTFTER